MTALCVDRNQIKKGILSDSFFYFIFFRFNLKIIATYSPDGIPLDADAKSYSG